MMDALQIIANSWPIAVMFIALLAAVTAHTIIANVQRARREDRAFSASQAKDVTARRDY